jgi:hypothetical protein
VREKCWLHERRFRLLIWKRWLQILDYLHAKERVAIGKVRATKSQREMEGGDTRAQDAPGLLHFFLLSFIMLLFPKMWDSGAKAFPKSPKFSAYF